MELEVQNIVHFKSCCTKICTQLIENRKDSQSTQEDIAKMIGVDRRVIASIENGDVLKYIEPFLKYCEVMDIQVRLREVF